MTASGFIAQCSSLMQRRVKGMEAWLIAFLGSLLNAVSDAVYHKRKKKVMPPGQLISKYGIMLMPL